MTTTDCYHFRTTYVSDKSLLLLLFRGTIARLSKTTYRTPTLLKEDNKGEDTDIIPMSSNG